jgi:hypothetical protein
LGGGNRQPNPSPSKELFTKTVSGRLDGSNVSFCSRFPAPSNPQLIATDYVYDFGGNEFKSKPR